MSCGKTQIPRTQKEILMIKKMYWGLTVLIVFVTITGFVFVRQSQEIEQLKQEAANSKKQRKKSKPKRAIVKENDTRPPPPGKSFENGGHWQGDEWHDAPHTTISNPVGQTIPSDFPVNSGTPKTPFWERLGLEPPDGDMTYAWDGNGNYYKDKVTFFKVATRRGYAPTLEQYEKAKQLREEARLAFNAGDVAKSNQLRAVHDKLIKASQGDVPFFTGSIYKARSGESEQEAISNIRRQHEEAERQLYREYGLEHLLTNNY